MQWQVVKQWESGEKSKKLLNRKVTRELYGGGGDKSAKILKKWKNFCSFKINMMCQIIWYYLIRFRFFMDFMIPVADPRFPRRGRQLIRGYANLLFCNIFAKNCVKMKEFGRVGGGGDLRPWRPLLSATGSTCVSIKFCNEKNCLFHLRSNRSS